MSKICCEQAAIAQCLRRIGVGTAQAKAGSEQASKVILKGKAGQAELVLIGTDRQLMSRSVLPLRSALEADVFLAVEHAQLADLSNSLDAGPADFEVDEKLEYLRYGGGGSSINLATVKAANFQLFEEEKKKAKVLGEFKREDMIAGLEYAKMFLGFTEGAGTKNPDSEILWVKAGQFVAGPGKVMGVFECSSIPVEFRTFLTGVEGMLKYLQLITSEKCRLSQFDDVYYFVEPLAEGGEVFMFPMSPRRPPMDVAPGEVLSVFKAKEDFKIDRSSLRKAVKRLRIVLADSKVMTFRLSGKDNASTLEVIAEDSKRQESSVSLSVIRSGSEEKVEFRLNYGLLESVLSVSNSPVVSIGLCLGNRALNVQETEEGRYKFNALLGWVVS